MKKRLFLLVLVLTGMTLSLHAQWEWLGDVLNEAVNEAYGDSSGSSSSSSSYSLRSGTYYGRVGNMTARMELSLGSGYARLYDASDGEYFGGGPAVVTGNILTIQYTEGLIAGLLETFTITGSSSFVSNNDGTRYSQQ